MHAFRTRFAKDIVAEFMPPRRPSRKVVILCDGMPSVPEKKAVLDYFSKKGFWVFHPRYRGSWESGGVFMKRSPHEDISDVIKGLKKPFTSLWDGVQYTVDAKEIWVIGSSFGGTAAVLSSMHPEVTGCIAFSPVVDWKAAENGVEPISRLKVVVKNAFGEAYRVAPGAWDKLKRGKLFNPVRHINAIQGHKLLIIHAKDDRIVPYGPLTGFAKKTGASLLLYKHGGHYSLSTIMQPRFAKKYTSFMQECRKLS